MSFMEVVEKEGGFCHNLKQTIMYPTPSQADLKAFLFSESERFSTFIIKRKRPLEKSPNTER